MKPPSLSALSVASVDDPTATASGRAVAKNRADRLRIFYVTPTHTLLPAHGHHKKEARRAEAYERMPKCPICTEPLLQAKDDPERTLSCNHAFHERCLFGWEDSAPTPEMVEWDDDDDVENYMPPLMAPEDLKDWLGYVEIRSTYTQVVPERDVYTIFDWALGSTTRHDGTMVAFHNTSLAHQQLFLALAHTLGVALHGVTVASDWWSWFGQRGEESPVSTGSFFFSYETNYKFSMFSRVVTGYNHVLKISVIPT